MIPTTAFPFRRIFWLTVIAALSSGISTAVGDVFVLQNGGVVRGRWINRQQRPLTEYVIAADFGGRFTIAADQVSRTVAQSPAELKYEQIAAAHSASVVDQWKLAEWCRTNKLDDHRKIHLRQILAVEPDHVGARHALGYSQVRGQWTLREEFQEAQGYEFFEGRWRLPQEIALLEKRGQMEKAEKDWQAKLRKWREMLVTDKAAQAHQQVSAIRDPLAVRALRNLFEEERLRQVKMLYIDVLAQIGNPAAANVLLDASLQDADPEIFHACLNRLVKLNPPGAVKRYVDALKDDNNVRVNRAAFALGKLQDASVLSPLIDALVTTHYTVLPGGSSDQYTSGFGGVSPPGFTDVPGSLSPSGNGAPFGGTHFAAGDQTKVIPSTVANQEVLTALIKLSDGANFGFDQKAWRYWLANENRRSAPSRITRRQ